MTVLTRFLAQHPAFYLPLCALAAILADWLLGEPRRWHPLAGFGRLADMLEARLNRPARPVVVRFLGMLAMGLAIAPAASLAFWCRQRSGLAWIVDILLCYFALGARSLLQHGEAVRRPLAEGCLPEARRHVGYMVSRDVRGLGATGIARAGVESILENGNDAIFATLFWFVLLGGPGALLLRLVNTLDAMWGYKSACFRHFGWAAARLDDLLNWLPARLTALTYALLGAPARALACWITQAPAWESPNAGVVMAAGAGSLDVRLGGNAVYGTGAEKREESRPRLGCGSDPDHRHLQAAMRLVERGLWFWLALFFLVGLCADLCS
ncbi:MAG: adenosylcobinamide-phosphate synthase CbiB [Zoogloeaceae bacterium]|jgi:adenosylcobinamide-phosphate synthase|nr:adenosylcobinamide-phosphate synthase CbiB [Zoogloeaceae bacterium]